MGNGCKTLYLSVCWMLGNAAVCRRSFWQLWTRKRTVFDSTIWETSMKRRWSILGVRTHISQRAHWLFECEAQVHRKIRGGSHGFAGWKLVLSCHDYVTDFVFPGRMCQNLWILAKDEYKICTSLLSLPSRGAWIEMWKVPSARVHNLGKLGIPKYYAHKWGYVKVCWNVAESPTLTHSITTNERLARVGYYSLSDKVRVPAFMLHHRRVRNCTHSGVSSQG